tara:strand:+ start:782 stop:970 length:189 start_codon:yes stop_codon:yes gene_type:complete
MQCIIWKDGEESYAQVISASDADEAIAQAADVLDVEPDEVNILFEERFGEAGYYGVRHAVPA